MIGLPRVRCIAWFCCAGSSPCICTQSRFGASHNGIPDLLFGRILLRKLIKKVHLVTRPHVGKLTLWAAGPSVRCGFPTTKRRLEPLFAKVPSHSGTNSTANSRSPWPQWGARSRSRLQARGGSCKAPSEARRLSRYIGRCSIANGMHNISARNNSRREGTSSFGDGFRNWTNTLGTNVDRYLGRPGDQSDSRLEFLWWGSESLPTRF